MQENFFGGTERTPFGKQASGGVSRQLVEVGLCSAGMLGSSGQHISIIKVM